MTMQCPGCHAQIVTTIQYEAGTLTWLACGGLILFGFVSYYFVLLFKIITNFN